MAGGLAALALAVAGVLSAAVPSSASEQEQSYIVVLKDSVADAGAAAAAQQDSYGLSVSTVYRSAVNGYAATMAPSAAARLAADPGVDFVTAAREFQQPTDPLPSTQAAPDWWQRMGGTPGDRTHHGADNAVDVNVAVIDSGIDATHPDLNVRGGIDCSTGSPLK
ncbi:protease inhibitor I9 family protein [Pseudarthrobacter sp. So.54]